MHNLQGIISKSVNNATMQFERLGYIATNSANMNTNAYKNVRFENYLKEDGRLEGQLRTDFSEGGFVITKRPLDVAICGSGFFPVTQKDGNTAYTRDGSFAINKDGLLVTNDGAIVGEGIKVPPNYYRLSVKKDGEVFVTLKINDKEEKIGKINIVNFPNPEELKLNDGNMYTPTEQSGKATIVENPNYIKQGGLEKSNVDMYATINDILKLNASMISSSRIIKMVDEIYRQSINLRQ